MNNDKPLINILTRTSNRPRGFRHNIESVRGQTYKNIRHIIYTDDQSSVSYIINEKISDYSLIDRNLIIKNDDQPKPKTGHRFLPHNLYFNRMIEDVSDGWVIYLDDDDRFVHNRVVEEIADIISKCNEDTLIYWRMVYSNGSYLPEVISENNPPRICQIGGSCMTFNIKYKYLAKWDGWNCGDFRVIERLHENIPNKIWIPKNYIYVPSAGFGDRKDIS